jgi:hypothetical protein
MQPFKNIFKLRELGSLPYANFITACKFHYCDFLKLSRYIWLLTKELIYIFWLKYFITAIFMLIFQVVFHKSHPNAMVKKCICDKNILTQKHARFNFLNHVLFCVALDFRVPNKRIGHTFIP